MSRLPPFPSYYISTFREFSKWGNVQYRRDEIGLWEDRAEAVVTVSANLQERAGQIAQHGIPALDAAHLASAEAGEADVLLTCDDVLPRRAQRLGLALRVINPVAYLDEVSTHG